MIHKLFCSDDGDVLFSINSGISIMYTTCNSFLDLDFMHNTYTVIDLKHKKVRTITSGEYYNYVQSKNDSDSMLENIRSYHKIKEIKATYLRGNYAYSCNELKTAKMEFVRVVKPILCKPQFRGLDIVYLSCLDYEVLDSMYKLGVIYQRNKTKDANYVKSAAIFQFCAKFAGEYMRDIVRSEFFVKQAHYVEVLFLKKYSSYISSICTPFDYQHKLATFRDKIYGELYTQNIEAVYQHVTEFFFNQYGTGLLQNIFSDCIRQLYQNVRYAIVALGSLSIGTGTPWSDLEYAVLVSDIGCIKYFRAISYLAHIKVINIGETMLRFIGVGALNNFKTCCEQDEWFWDLFPISGISIDGAHPHACKTPLGRKGYMFLPNFKLIVTPHLMVEYQYNIDPHLSQALLNVAFIQGDVTLLNEYRSKLQAKISSKQIDTRIITTLESDLCRYKLGSTIANKIDVKKDIYRLIDRIIVGLGNYYGIMADNGQALITSWEILNKMHGLIDDKTISDLHDALSLATLIRLLAFYHTRKSIIRVNNNEEVKQLIIRFYDIMVDVQTNIAVFCDICIIDGIDH